MIDANRIWADVQAIRTRNPLVHNVTNYVVMNNTANALLAIGASPVMAHAVDELDDMVGLTKLVGGALVVNIGTLDESWVESMGKAMHAAAARTIPMVFDPVGSGATPYRTRICRQLLEQSRPSVIRGNASEIMSLLDAGTQTKGVDSAHDALAAEELASQLAVSRSCVVSVSGATDVVTDGLNSIRIGNGVAMMTRVTGLGCTASALTGAFLAVNPTALQAAAHAMAVMGICGEIAAEKSAGPGSLQMHFLDALYQLDADQISRRLRCA